MASEQNVLKIWLSISAMLLAFGDFRFKNAQANECSRMLQIISADGLRHHSEADWRAMGRLAHLARVMNSGDSAAIKLLFAGPHSSYAFARRKLQQHHAHFIRERLAQFQPLRSFFSAPDFDPIGSGQIELRVTKIELANLRPYIELAQQIEVEDFFGIENDEHVLKGHRAFNERVASHEADYWQWLKNYPTQIVRVQTLTNYDKKTFQSVARRMKHAQNIVRVTKMYYDPLLSIGYMELEGLVQDLPRVVEGLPEIHMIRAVTSDAKLF